MKDECLLSGDLGIPLLIHQYTEQWSNSFQNS